jgi:hypothetical protein
MRQAANEGGQQPTGWQRALWCLCVASCFFLLAHTERSR